jgi:hypothetical protein
MHKTPPITQAVSQLLLVTTLASLPAVVNGLVFVSNNKTLLRQDNKVGSSSTSAATASATLEVTLPVDRLQLTAVAGGTACTTTIAIVGDDAFCAATPAQLKCCDWRGAGNL